MIVDNEIRYVDNEIIGVHYRFRKYKYDPFLLSSYKRLHSLSASV
jgi:hypothetical protein